MSKCSIWLSNFSDQTGWTIWCTHLRSESQLGHDPFSSKAFDTFSLHNILALQRIFSLLRDLAREA